MTDPETATRTYVGPMTVESLEDVIIQARPHSPDPRCALQAAAPAGSSGAATVPCGSQEKPDALLPTMGGQTALNLAKALAEVGKLAL